MTTDEYERMIRVVNDDLMGWLARIKVCCVAKPGWSLDNAARSAELLKAGWVGMIAGLNEKAIAFTTAMRHPPQPWTIDAYCHEITLAACGLLNAGMGLSGPDALSWRDVLLLYDRELPKIPQPSVN